MVKALASKNSMYIQYIEWIAKIRHTNWFTKWRRNRPRPRPIGGSPTLCLISSFCVPPILLPFSYAHQQIVLFFFFCFFDFFSFVFCFYNFGFPCLNITKFFICNFIFCTFIIGLEIFIFIIFMLSYRILLCFISFSMFSLAHYSPDFNQNFQKLLHIYLLLCACVCMCL